MPIQLGAPPENSFDTPLGLLSDCHRRIERFLEQLLHVTETAGGRPLDPAQRDALEAALRYFREAAPLHTQDEEASLFPRLRASGLPAARAALAALERLEADHDRADAAHAEVDRLGRAWLTDGTLPEAAAGRLAALLGDLRETYRRHIAVEDSQIFPLANRALTPDEIAHVGREMALRRGLDPGRLPSASRPAPRRGTAAGHSRPE